MTADEILALFEVPGLNVEAALEPREYELFKQAALNLYARGYMAGTWDMWRADRNEADDEN
jgi:hypothetical protein